MVEAHGFEAVDVKVDGRPPMAPSRRAWQTTGECRCGPMSGPRTSELARIGFDDFVFGDWVG